MPGKKARKTVIVKDWVPETPEAWFISSVSAAVLYLTVYQFQDLPFEKSSFVALCCGFGLSLLAYLMVILLSTSFDSKGGVVGCISASWRKWLVVTLAYLPIPITFFYRLCVR